MSDLPRVLLCSFDVLPGPTGFSRRVTEYLKGLCNRFTVVVLSTKTQDLSHIERYHGSRLLRVPVGAGDLASRLQTFERAVRRQLESEEYAIAHFTDPFGGYVLSELKTQYGYRAIYEANGFPSQEIKYAHPSLAGDRRLLAKVRRQELFCLMNADRVLTSSNVSRQFIQSLGVPQENLRVLRSPVDLGPYTSRPMGEPDATPMRIVYLGSQISWQGLPTLLHAVKRALAQVDLRLTLVGPPHPDWQPQLEELIKTLQLAGKVELQPPLGHDELYKALATADLGVVPLESMERNRLQGGPLAKVSEYLAAGRPVVASDLPVCRELLPEGMALFFKPGDAEDLADCLVELANTPKLRVEMGRKARAEAIRHLDASLIRAQLLGIYDELLGRGEHPAAAEPPAPTATGTPTRRVSPRSEPDTSPIEVTRTDPAIPLPVSPSDSGPPVDERRAVEHDTDPLRSRPEPTPEERPVIAAAAEGLPPDTDPEGRRPDPELPTSFIDLDKLRDAISQTSASRLPAPRWNRAGTSPAPPPQPEPRLPTPPLEIPLPPNPDARPLRPTAAGPALEARPAPVPAPAPARSAPPAVPTPPPQEAGPAPTAPAPPELPAPSPAPTPGLEARPAPVAPSPEARPAPPPAAAPHEAGQAPSAAPEAPPAPGRDVPLPQPGPAPSAGTPPPAEARPSPVAPPAAPEAPSSPSPAGTAPDASAPPAPAAPKAPPSGAPTAALEEPASDQPEEIADELVEAVEDEADPEEAQEIDPDEVLEAEEPGEELPPSRIDPWFAQLAHGYCPPEGLQFARHTPPTTFPGRDEAPPRSRTGELPAVSTPSKA